jgi:hypothetical protein
MTGILILTGSYTHYLYLLHHLLLPLNRVAGSRRYDAPQASWATRKKGSAPQQSR